MPAGHASPRRVRQRGRFSAAVAAVLVSVALVASACGSGSPSKPAGGTTPSSPGRALPTVGKPPPPVALAKGMVEELRPFGAGMSPGETDWSGLEKDFAEMRAAGTIWVRIYIGCGNPLSYWDRVIAMLREHGLQLLANINCNVGGANSVAGPYTPRQYIAWLGAFVRRYHATFRYDHRLIAADVHYYEIGNEENNPQEFDSEYYCTAQNPRACTATVTDYMYRMHDAYTTVHANDPHGYVIWGGLTEYNAEYYFDAMLTATVTIKGRVYHPWDFMDGMGFHPYANPTTTHLADPVLGSLARIEMAEQKKSLRPGFAGKPLWITEVGLWCSGDGDLSYSHICPESARAAALTRLFDAIKANGIHTPVFWYIFHEPSRNVPGFGLVEVDRSGSGRTFLPAYTAYKDYRGFDNRRTGR